MENSQTSNSKNSPSALSNLRLRVRAERERRQYDEDCEWLHLLGYSLYPEGIEFYGLREFDARGYELSQQKNPIVPSHLDPEDQKRTMASVAFESLYERTPTPGDKISLDVMRAYYLVHEQLPLSQMEEAFRRRVPGKEFPLKFENGNLYRYAADPINRHLRQWTLDDSTPEVRWKQICDQMRRDGHNVENCKAAIFIQSAENGRYRTAPYDGEPEEIPALIKRLREIRDRIQ